MAQKNYYEILEVDKNASNEIIEKAYKTLAKRYHPDLQDGPQKKEYEEKMKMINEAYSVLSDSTQKATYDEQLKDFTVSIEEYQNIVQENMLLRQEIQKLQNNTQNQYVNNINYQTAQKQYDERINRAVNEAVNQAYQDAYVQDMKNRGYRFKRKYTIKDYIKLAGIIAGLILILLIIAQIPPVKRFLADLYENNIIIKALVDTFKTGF